MTHLLNKYNNWGGREGAYLSLLRHNSRTKEKSNMTISSGMN